MLVAAGRDIDSTFFLDSRLSKAREALIALVLDGEEPEPDFVAKLERSAVDDLKEIYFNARMRQAVKLDAGLTDEEDYAQHSQKLVERAIWWTHERLKAIPFVGQDGFGDD